MISIRRLRPGEGQLYKEVRLAALKDAPYAFTTTYASALSRSPESWSAQADGSATGPDRCTVIAFADESPVGIAAVYRNEESREDAELLQVWVAPDFRGTGVARDLVDTLIDWCADNGIRRVFAGITQGNDRALRFYRKCGLDVVDSVPAESPGGVMLARRVEFE